MSDESGTARSYATVNWWRRIWEEGFWWTPIWITVAVIAVFLFVGILVFGLDASPPVTPKPPASVQTTTNGR